jgi:hypothetical protein
MQVQLQLLTSGAVVRAVKWVAVFVALGLGVVTYADQHPDEILDPPSRLASAVPYKDQIGCTDCGRGPYILDTDQEGSTPEDLSKLVIKVESAIDEDLGLFVLTDFRVEDGSVRFSRSSVVCISDEALGSEICRITSESQLKQIRGRPIYIFVGNFGPENHRFTLTAEWEPARPPLCRAETCLPLVSNAPVTKTIEANGFRFTHEEKQARLATFTVPAGAQVLALRVRAANPQANVDAFIGRSGLGPQDNPADKASFALVSSFGEEMLILPRPPAGSYWLAVLNRANEPQEVEVIVTVLMDLQELPSGAPVSGQVNTEAGLLPFLVQYLRSSQGTLAPTQYRLSLKEADLQGVTALQITLRGPGAPNLHLRFDKIVEIKEGRIAADLSAVGPATEKILNLSGALLKPGAIYLAVEALGALPQGYELRAELMKAGSQANEKVLVPLEPVWVQVSDGR